ncbi:MAG TPA: hypothetical protein VHA33_06205 [Candidatus Angelobacter sp.]|nr:hypothetical protein [Candidatus Angelobacter sp.]
MKLIQLTSIVLWSVLGLCQDGKNLAPTPPKTSTDFDCHTTSKTCTINIANQNTSKDEKTSGPKTIIVTGANTLRYVYTFNSTVTFSNASPIDLSTLGLAPKVPTPDAKAQADTQNKKAAASTAATKLNTLKASNQGAAELAAFDVAPMTSTITEVFATNEQELEVIENEANRTIQAANDSAQRVNRAAQDMRALLLNSDSILQSKGDAVLKRQINDRKLEGTCPSEPVSGFQIGLCASWPTTQEVNQLVNRAQAMRNHVRQKQDVATQNLTDDEARLNALDFRVADQSPPATTQKGRAALSANSQQQALSSKANMMTFWITRRSVYSAVGSQTDDQLARLDDVLKKLTDIAVGGKNNTDFLTAQQDLKGWNDRLLTVSQAEAPFTLPPHKASCGFSFAGSKTNKVELAQKDLLPPALTTSEPGSSSSSAKAAAATPKTIPLITVECSSPFAMSAGVAFSSITERDFVIQKGADGQNHFVTDAHSNFHPLPLAMVNMRYKEFSRRFGLYGSFGVAANIKGQSAGGSDPEYLFTPLTFGFFRTAFISPGLHIGRDIKLGSNFHEGDVVPASITTPPLQKSYKMAFGIAVTFSKP